MKVFVKICLLKVLSKSLLMASFTFLSLEQIIRSVYIFSSCYFCSSVKLHPSCCTWVHDFYIIERNCLSRMWIPIFAIL